MKSIFDVNNGHADSACSRVTEVAQRRVVYVVTN